jgi:cysteinyl-tRNA synthetase
MLQIYNSLTRKKEIFTPITPGQIRMYVCGMTVYDYCHIGHARVMVVFDVIRRWLRAAGFDVTYVRNITDIDDRIIKRAAENGESIFDLTARFIRFMEEDAAALDTERPDAEPRATRHVPDMLRIIELLMRRGLAYRADNGDVYYAVRGFDGYGKLSGKSLEDLRAGERVEIDAAKRDPMDFVLWKAAKPGEPSWESPWGPGRPGWHIECSAMSEHFLGEQFDIHGGGQDLIFPHHENEIAQSEGAHGHAFVNYWVHNGFVRVDDEKMSKSLGNFFTVREVLARYHPEVVRFFIVRAHYRSPLNYSDQHLDDAKATLKGLYLALRDVPVERPATVHKGDSHWSTFEEAMNDDFNTPEAVAVLSQVAHELNLAKRGLAQADIPESERQLLTEARDDSARQLVALGAILGLLQRDPDAYLQGDIRIEVPAADLKLTAHAPVIEVLSKQDIDELIAQRTAARKAKNFAEADRVRKDLEASGILLEDKPDGTTSWRRK